MIFTDVLSILLLSAMNINIRFAIFANFQAKRRVFARYLTRNRSYIASMV